MIIYSTRTKKLPLSIEFYNNESNMLKMFRYNEGLMSNCGDYTIQKKITSDVYYTYNALVHFNNLLDDDNDYNNSFDILDKYLKKHSDIKESKDIKCIRYYNKMYYWFNVYTNSLTKEKLKSICKEIQQLMKFLEKQGIVKKSGCNLKRNYID